MIDPDVFFFAALWQQYRRCRRNKRNSANALAFELDAEANLLALQSELRARSYRPGRSVCFITDGPKPREVFAADFRDRIVHHLLVAHQERVFEPIFIHDSYACRMGKGTLAASDRLSAFLRQATANGQRSAWGLKLDVASFFPSIHKATLDQIIARHVADPSLLWLTRTVLFHDPTRNYRFRSRDPRTAGPTSPRYPVPRQKSLFGRDNERGLPIGNLTSQFWANVYLNELDQFIKRELRCRQYIRYVDDLVLLAPDPQTLVVWCAARGQPGVLRNGLPHRVLWPAASSRHAGARPATHSTAAGVLRVRGGFSAAAVRCVSSPRARTGIQGRLGPAGPSRDGRALGTPTDQD